MADVLGVVFIAIVALVIAAAAVYLGGFLISMFVSLFGSVSDAATHHHHRGQPLPS